MIPKTIQQKINEGRSYRNTQEFRATEEEKIVEGYATTFDEEYTLWEDDDYVIREKVDREAFRDADLGDVIMQYDHEGRVFARISNGTLSLEADDHGLHVRADLSGTELGRQLYEEIRGGYTTKMSFGFTVAADEWLQRKTEDGKEEMIRTITAIRKLYDVSAVSLPANNATEISARCLCEGVIAEAAEERRKKEERERRKRKIKLMMEV